MSNTIITTASFLSREPRNKRQVLVKPAAIRLEVFDVKVVASSLCSNLMPPFLHGARRVLSTGTSIYRPITRHFRQPCSIFQRLGRSHSSLPKHSGTFHVRHVRFVQPFFTWDRLRRSLFWTIVLGLLTHQVLGLLADDEVDDSKSTQVREAVRQVKKATEGEKIGPDGEVGAETKEVQAEEVSDDEWESYDDSENSLFIPLSWPKKRPKEFYKGTDAEWKSFTDFSRDVKRIKAIKGMPGRLYSLAKEEADQITAELASIIGNLGVDTRLQRILGSPIKVSKYWLDVDYPYGPPQDYEQMGYVGCIVFELY